MTDTAGIPGDRICSFIERIERIDEEIKALSEGKKEVFSEAKGEGFDVKVLKEILRLRKQDKDERRTGVPARPVSQGYGERRRIASKGGIAPSRRRTSGPLKEPCFSPRFSAPSTNSMIRKACRGEATHRVSTSDVVRRHFALRSQSLSSGRPEPRGACRG